MLLGLPYLPVPATAISDEGPGTPGVPESQAILGGKFNETRIRRRLRTLIETTPGVRSILSLSILFDNAARKLSIACRVNTVFGPSGVISAELT
jgi:hypothetical protein